MDDALILFGIASVLLTGSLAIRAVADWWLRAKQLERDRNPAPTAAPLAAPGVEARLAQIERAVDTIAIEIERVAEAQRFSARLLEERRQAEAELVPAPEGREPAVPEHR